MTAARVTSEGTPVVAYAPNVPFQAVAPTAPAASPVLDPDSLVDLTSTFDAESRVRFSPQEPGHWVVFGFWQRPTDQAVMDHLSEGPRRR